MGYFVIIRGPLGSGKSTVAKKIAKAIDAKYVSIDRLLDSGNLTKDIEGGMISQKSFLKANEIAMPEAKKFLDKGIPVVFDGNFYWKSQIENLQARLNCKNYVFTLKAPLEVCIERDKNRKKTHGIGAAKAVYAKSTEFDFGIGIDATRALDEEIKTILSFFPKKSGMRV